MSDSNKTRVFQLTPEASLAYIANANKYHRWVKRCHREVLKTTGREAALFDHSNRTYLAGLAVNPPKWRETETARLKAESEARGEQRSYFGSIADAPIPAGWRKRVKDDYLSPPLKGGGPEAQAARDLVNKWRSENLRGYVQRVHGIKIHVFAGLHFVTIGIDVMDEKTDHPTVYVISSGPEQKVENLVDAVEIKHSAYLIAKGE